jgi:primase-polymerase (primpol)-like protein
MKAHWLIVPLIIILIPLFFLSREQILHRVDITDEGLDLNEEDMAMLISEEEESAIYESVSKFRMHMKSLDEYDDALAESMEIQNWDDISKYALMLKNTSPLIFTGMRKVELPKDFVLLDTAFHFQSLAVVEACESREMVKMNIEYEKLKKTCDDCHEKYKKKE